MVTGMERATNSEGVPSCSIHLWRMEDFSSSTVAANTSSTSDLDWAEPDLVSDSWWMPTGIFHELYSLKPERGSPSGLDYLLSYRPILVWRTWEPKSPPKCVFCIFHDKSSTRSQQNHFLHRNLHVAISSSYWDLLGKPESSKMSNISLNSSSPRIFSSLPCFSVSQ